MEEREGKRMREKRGIEGEGVVTSEIVKKGKSW